MHRVTVELDWDTVDNIIVTQLKDGLRSMRLDHENRKAGHGMAIFDNDRDLDIAMMKHHIKSFETLIKYYGGEDALKDC